MKTTSINLALETDPHLYKTKRLRIDRLGINGDIYEVDFEDLAKFPNLQSLTVASYDFSFDDFKKMCESNISELILINCEMRENVEELISKSNISNLTLNNVVNIDVSKIEKDFKYLELRDVDCKLPKGKIALLDITFCEFSGDDFLKIEADKIVINVSQYQKYKDIILKNKMKATIMADNGVIKLGEV